MAQIHYLHPTRMRTEYQSPISAMNITPLIDVMLVLLVMLILCLPLATHQVEVPLPAVGKTNPSHIPITQKLVLTNDGVSHWNGTAVDDIVLGENLRATASAGDQLQIQTEGNARYERFDHLIALVRQSGITRLGFVGNEQFAQFGK